MLIGQFESKVSDKQQVSFPKKFREILGDSIVITKGFDKNLVVVSKQNWETLLEGTEGLPFTNKNARDTQRFLLGNAYLVTLDSKGRFIIPEYLREYANLSKELIFVGIRKFVEIWDKHSWNEQQNRLAKDIEAITLRLEKDE